MIAVYARVSSTTQDTKSQDRELQRWAGTQDDEVKWYRDKATGTKMDRPGMTALLTDIRAGVITQVVVWRLDRLGRTAKGLLQFFEEELAPRKVGFVSLRDAVDLSTPSGRLMLTILAAVAQFETEVRSERQRAGIEAARAKNDGRCHWGGRRKGTRVKVSAEKEAAVKAMYEADKPIAEIARVVGLGRQSVYRVLGLWQRPATA